MKTNFSDLLGLWASFLRKHTENLISIAEGEKTINNLEVRLTKVGSSLRTNWMLELLEVLIFLGGLSQPGWQINRSKCQSYINSNHAQQRWKDKKINISIFQKKIYVADWKFEEYFKHVPCTSSWLPGKTTGNSKRSSESISN